MSQVCQQLPGATKTPNGPEARWEPGRWKLALAQNPVVVVEAAPDLLTEWGQVGHVLRAEGVEEQGPDSLDMARSELHDRVHAGIGQMRRGDAGVAGVRPA